jgi:hypothetical protein
MTRKMTRYWRATLSPRPRARNPQHEYQERIGSGFGRSQGGQCDPARDASAMQRTITSLETFIKQQHAVLRLHNIETPFRIPCGTDRSVALAPEPSIINMKNRV